MNQRAHAVLIQGRRFTVQASAERRRYWKRVSSGGWEPHSFHVFERFLRPGSICVYIGAWIGPTTLFAAHLARRVLALEPDPAAYAELAGHLLERRLGDGPVAANEAW